MDDRPTRQPTDPLVLASQALATSEFLTEQGLSYTTEEN